MVRSMAVLEIGLISGTAVLTGVAEAKAAWLAAMELAVAGTTRARAKIGGRWVMGVRAVWCEPSCAQGDEADDQKGEGGQKAPCGSRE